MARPFAGRWKNSLELVYLVYLANPIVSSDSNLAKKDMSLGSFQAAVLLPAPVFAGKLWKA